MTKKTARPAALILWLAFALAALAVGGSARQTPQSVQVAPQPSRALTPQERRGKALYLRGESATNRELTAVIGEIDVPASTVNCAGCHGARGEGKTEGGVTAGNLTWANLLKPYGHTHPTGRKHGPFDEASFVRAVVGGVDPNGNTLLVAMPRYKLSPEDAADLVAYLKRIESDQDPGITDTTLRVGTVLPTQGALADTGAAMRDVLNAYFSEVNSRGGVYNRKLELRVADAGTGAAATLEPARRLAGQEDVFAVVGGVTAGADAEIAALARQDEIPFVGPATLTPQSASPANRYVFYLLPGLSEQARALVNFAATKPQLKKARVLIVRREGETGRAVGAAVEEQARLAGWENVSTQTYGTAPAADMAQLVGKWKGSNDDAVFFVGAGGEEAAFIREAAAAGWTPNVFLVAALTGRDLVNAVPATFKDKVFVAFPSVPTDITPEGVAEFGALREKYKFAPRHAASQLAAFAAAKIFVEGLRRAGQDLSREKLITALEGLYNFETGVTPPITFGPNRRIGANASAILTVDPEKKEFVNVTGR
ncbi:MAG: ABC transporter substrate-binding protein [Acidobacteria bacterium]|nr:ABC transporter substrate-binding protein [Acidobacteriota bacterium]